MTQTYQISMGPMGFSTEKRCSVTVLRGHTQLFITVNMARIKDTYFGKELSQMIKRSKAYPFGRTPPHLDPSNLIYEHCLPLIERLAPETALLDLTLECFLHSPTYHLEIIDAGNSQDVRIDGADDCAYTPAFSMSPMRTVDLPNSCKATLQLRASGLQIAPKRDEGSLLDSVQGEVVTTDGDLLYFKPRHDAREPDFDRELRILSCFDEIDLPPRIRVPRLQGIVVSGDNGEETMGVLMTMIPTSEVGKNLMSPKFWSMIELHKKWDDQVRAIVRELHANDIVWGDVNPMNVVIDEAMDAWVIDFGGMNNVEFVDDDKRETMEGDEQGITRLFQEWLPSHYRAREVDDAAN